MTCTLYICRYVEQIKRPDFACLHILFHIDTPLVTPDVIGADAITAAIDIVNVCIQHAAFLARRGDINEISEEMAKGEIMSCVQCN